MVAIEMGPKILYLLKDKYVHFITMKLGRKVSFAAHVCAISAIFLSCLPNLVWSYLIQVSVGFVIIVQICPYSLWFG